MTTTITKVLIKSILKTSNGENILEEVLELLFAGDLLGAETVLIKFFHSLYDKTIVLLLEILSASKEFKACLKKKGYSLGFKKYSNQKCKVQLSTGTWVFFKSLYAQQAPKENKKERSLFHLYFKTINKASPLYISRATQLSVITPSFSIAEQVLCGFECKGAAERNRQLCLSTGEVALENRVGNMLFSGETLANKRVIIGIDGGRTRTRDWKENNSSKYGTFDTPWKEPKLLVITTIDDNGKVDKITFPIYDACFGDDELFELLEQYLISLDINQAQGVQIVGDGAPWIWNRARPMLLKLGVEDDKITEVLDYYHAVQHLYDLEKYLPEQERAKAMKMLKDLLWKGDIVQMKEILSKLLPNLESAALKPFEYFEKNKSRMQYDTYRNMKIPIGSGIVESGIRRVINLRFKCPSSFWNIENLQPLIYLRAAFGGGDGTI